MKTFDAPSVNADDAPLSAAGSSAGLEEDSGAMLAAKLPAARRTAILSLLPGLGQLRNGETAKGILFLSISMANAFLLLALIAGDIFKPALASTAMAFQRQPNWELGAPLQAGFLHSPALAVCALLTMAFVAYAVRDAYDGAVRIIKSGGQKLPRARLTLSEATSGSYLFHMTLMVTCLLVVILFITPMPKATQVTQILLEHDKPKEAKPAPKHEAVKRPEPPKVQPKPIVQPKPVVVKPVVQKPVVVQPPKPAPVAVAVPVKEPAPLQLAPVESAPAPVAAAPAPSGSSSAGGSQTGTGEGGNGDAEVDMGPYMRDLQKRIKAHWYPPKGNENKTIKVSFKIFKDGHITNLKLVISSGVGMADDAAMAAVQQAAPFATLPAGVGDDVDINFKFDYHVFGGRSL